MNLQTGAKVVAVIPARFASTRFPGKMIEPLAGKPLVVHTYQRALSASSIEHVLIATDDSRVVNALKPYDIDVRMTRSDHLSGTDRIAEVAEILDADIVVNVQGDEPLIDPAAIDAAVQALLDDPEAAIATTRHAIQEPSDIDDPNVVKVVTDQRGRALYFSRSRIPYIRDEQNESVSDTVYWQHIGLYVFRRDFLLHFPKLPPSPLEQLEKLEQLRALEHGYRIVVVDTEHAAIGVDTREDFERVKALIERKLDNG